MTFFTYLHFMAPALAGLAWLVAAGIFTSIFPSDEPCSHASGSVGGVR
jgi:hypothetical protein